MKIKKLIVGSVLTLVGISSFAAPQTPKEVEFLKKVNTTYPKLAISDAVYLPSVQLYELHKKGDIRLMYTNETLSYILMNNELLDLKNQKNISKEREALNVNRFYAELPKEKSIPVKFGDGSKGVAIFTDPDCPYCKSLDKEIHTTLKNQNMTINYYMNPLKIAGHELAPLEAKKIWCSEDKSKAWVDWMLNGKLPTNNGSCPNPVDETKALATSVGFNVTPVLIFDNGYVVKGSISSKEFSDILNRPPIANGIR